MPTSTSPNIGLLERRIIELLTTTNLTFKEIILQLDGENLSASIGIIRRINRDNRYRRPRYDSKLTPAQRESLVGELRDHQGVKPNLSLLAKRYGVCHGSVWYWWDKLNRVKQRCEPPTHQRRVPHFRAKSFLRHSQQMQLIAGASARHHHHHQAGALRNRAAIFKERHPMRDSNSGPERFNLVGRVSIVMQDNHLSAVELPILMFSRAEHLSGQQEDEWPMGEMRGREPVGRPLDIAGADHPSSRKIFEFGEGPMPLVKAAEP